MQNLPQTSSQHVQFFVLKAMLHLEFCRTLSSPNCNIPMVNFYKFENKLLFPIMCMLVHYPNTKYYSVSIDAIIKSLTRIRKFIVMYQANFYFWIFCLAIAHFEAKFMTMKTLSIGFITFLVKRVMSSSSLKIVKGLSLYYFF